MTRITYYALAVNPRGQIAQLLVTRLMGERPGECIERRQEWTGITYRTRRAAITDVARLNGATL